MTPGSGMGPWPHWWEARALTTALPCSPNDDSSGVCNGVSMGKVSLTLKF